MTFKGTERHRSCPMAEEKNPSIMLHYVILLLSEGKHLLKGILLLQFLNRVTNQYGRC